MRNNVYTEEVKKTALSIDFIETCKWNKDILHKNEEIKCINVLNVT